MERFDEGDGQASQRSTELARDLLLASVHVFNAGETAQMVDEGLQPVFIMFPAMDRLLVHSGFDLRGAVCCNELLPSIRRSAVGIPFHSHLREQLSRLCLRRADIGLIADSQNEFWRQLGPKLHMGAI
jgi:hypothetical protein